MIDINELIKTQFGVDLEELAEAHASLIASGIVTDHLPQMQALSSGIGYAVGTRDAVGLGALLSLLFAIGYAAGRDAPDLSAFEDALKGGAK